jgi:hypothetical protein
VARGEPQPTKYWLSNLGKAVSLEELAGTAKPRWRIDRVYHELKQEIGPGHLRAVAPGPFGLAVKPEKPL